MSNGRDTDETTVEVAPQPRIAGRQPTNRVIVLGLVTPFVCLVASFVVRSLVPAGSLWSTPFTTTLAVAVGLAVATRAVLRASMRGWVTLLAGVVGLEVLLTTAILAAWVALELLYNHLRCVKSAAPHAV